MAEFASCIIDDTGKPYDPKKHCLQWVNHCLTHLTFLMFNIAVVWLTSLTLQLRLCSLHTASPNTMTQHLQKTLWWLPMMAFNVTRWVWFMQLQLRWFIHLITVGPDLNSAELRNDHLHSTRSSFSMCSSILMMDTSLAAHPCSLCLTWRSGGHHALSCSRSDGGKSFFVIWFLPSDFSPLAGDHLLYSDASAKLQSI